MRIVFLLILLLINFVSSAQTSVAQWYSGNAIADGKINEWHLPLRFYDDKTHLQYNVVNNDSFLFVVVRLSEPSYQMKVIHAGLKFIVDTTGKKKSATIISFPMGSSGTIQKKQPDQQGQEPFGVNGLRARMKSQLLQMLLAGFKSANGIDSTTASNGVSAGADWDSSGVLNIEFKVPFTSFYHILSAPADANKPFLFTLTENSSPMPPMHAGHSGDDNGNDMGGDENGGMGGGMHHGMDHTMNSDSTGGYSDWRNNQEFFDTLSTTFKIQPATSPH